jgi:hypothetical protein
MNMSKKSVKMMVSQDRIDTGPVKGTWIKIVDNVPQPSIPPTPVRRVFFGAADDGTTNPTHFGYFDLTEPHAAWVTLLVDSMNGLINLKLGISTDDMTSIAMTSKDDFGSLTTPIKTNTSNKVHYLVNEVIVYA